MSGSLFPCSLQQSTCPHCFPLLLVINNLVGEKSVYINDNVSGWDDVNWRARWGCAYCICIIRFSISGKSLRKNQRSSRLNALLTSRTCSSITSSHSTQPSGIELMWVNGCLKMSNIRSLILFLSDTCVFPNLMQSSMVAGSYQLAGSSICNRSALGGVCGGGVNLYSAHMWNCLWNGAQAGLSVSTSAV